MAGLGARSRRGRAAVPAPWTGLEGLLDRATDVEAVRTHRLQTAAARRWRAAGRHVPEDFVQLERWAAGTLLAAPETQLLLLAAPEVDPPPRLRTRLQKAAKQRAARTSPVQSVARTNKRFARP